jgi:hypothetical protein
MLAHEYDESLVRDERLLPGWYEPDGPVGDEEEMAIYLWTYMGEKAAELGLEPRDEMAPGRIQLDPTGVRDIH